MLPTISDGEKVLIRRCEKEPKEGDIVLYIAKNELKLHRIIGTSGKGFFIVKGD